MTTSPSCGATRVPHCCPAAALPAHAQAHAHAHAKLPRSSTLAAAAAPAATVAPRGRVCPVWLTTQDTTPIMERAHRWNGPGAASPGQPPVLGGPPTRPLATSAVPPCPDLLPALPRNTTSPLCYGIPPPHIHPPPPDAQPGELRGAHEPRHAATDNGHTGVGAERL